MALCDIAEFQFATFQQGGVVPIAEEPPYIVQPQLAVTGAAASSVPFSASTKFIMISTDVPLRFRVALPVAGVPVAATASDRRLDIGGYFCGIKPGHCLSVILTT